MKTASLTALLRERISFRPLGISRLALLWLVALLPRLVAAALFFQAPIALDDMFQYDMLARSIASGHGYRWYTPADIEVLRPYLKQILNLDQVNPPPEGFLTTFRPPGYPFFLAGLYSLVPLVARFGYVRLVQAALMALLSPMVALLAGKAGANRRTSTLAGLGMALYPILWFYPAALASEDLFIPLAVGSLLLIITAAGSQRLWASALAGLTLGLAMLTRSVIASFVLLAAIWQWRYAKLGRKAALVFLGVAFGVCLPWAVRNSLIMGRPAFLESSLGFQAYIGYHPQGDGGFISQIAIPPMSILDDTQRDAVTSAEAMSFIRADPAGALLRIVRRVGFFMGAEDRELFYFYTNGFFGNILQPWLALAYLGIVLPWLIICLLAATGLLLAPNRPAAGLALLFIFGYSLPHLLIIAEPRFHLALVPVLLPFAALAWSQRKATIQVVFNRRGLAAWLVRLALLGMVICWIWGFAYHWDKILTVMSPGGFNARFYY